MKHWILFCVWLIASGASAAAPPAGEETVKPVVEHFYGLYLKLGVSGLPDRKQTAALAPFLAPSLRKLLAAAERKQAVEIQRHPDQVPPWSDGDLFSSLFEGAQSFQAGQPVISGGNALVPVHLERRGARSQTRWTDTFVLTLGTGGWQIADVHMGGKWAFRTGKTLTRTLAIP